LGKNRVSSLDHFAIGVSCDYFNGFAMLFFLGRKKILLQGSASFVPGISIFFALANPWITKDISFHKEFPLMERSSLTGWSLWRVRHTFTAWSLST